jgi:hypothetical protein
MKRYKQKSKKSKGNEQGSSIEAIERLNNARNVLREQVKQGGFIDSIFEIEELGYHISIVVMTNSPDVKVNAYGDMKDPRWVALLKDMELEGNGTFTDSEPDEDCPACGGTGIFNDSLN